mgnify:CR=1 FL=1
MTILVTGASGFLGKKLIIELSKSKKKIIAIHRSDVDKALLKLANVKWLNIDLANPGNKLDALPKIDTVVHLAGATLGAGKEDGIFFNSNELTTFNMLDKLSRKCTNFIYASSQVVYGDVGSLSVSETLEIDVTESAYACSKVNSENWLKWFQNKSQGSYMSLRFCGFIDGGGLIDYIVDSALLGRDIELFSNGSIVRDYISSQDGINAILKSIDCIENFKNKYVAINIGSGQTVTALKLAQLIINSVESKSQITSLNQDGPQGNFILDISEANKLLGFKPSVMEDEITKYALKKKKGYEK